MIRWKIHKIKLVFYKKNLRTSFRDQRLRKFISLYQANLTTFNFPQVQNIIFNKKRGGKKSWTTKDPTLIHPPVVFFLEDFYGCLWNSHHLQGWRYCPLWCRCHVILRCHHRRGRCHGWHHHPGRARGTGLGHGGLGGNFCWEESFHFQGPYFSCRTLQKGKERWCFSGVESWTLWFLENLGELLQRLDLLTDHTIHRSRTLSPVTFGNCHFSLTDPAPKKQGKMEGGSA